MELKRFMRILTAGLLTNYEVRQIFILY